MFKWFEKLPVELVGTNVLGMLGIRDIVMLERTCGSKASHQHIMNMIPYCPPVVLPYDKHDNISSLEWFAKRRCKITSLTVTLRLNTPALHVKNLQVDNIDLRINSEIDMHNCQPLFESDLRYKVKSVYVEEVQNTEVIALLMKTCTELISIELNSKTTVLDDSVVNIIAQHCPKLERLMLSSINNITYKSLIALSERGLPLKKLDINPIPNIPTDYIAGRCSYALSCIRDINTDNLHRNGQDPTIILPYMTGLTCVYIDYYCHSYVPLLTQHCHKITSVYVFIDGIVAILSLCHANPLLQELWFLEPVGITDTALIELIYACPHLHTLWLPYEYTINDIDILVLSEHFTQLQCLIIMECTQVSEAAVLQLLQRCRKLTALVVSRSSLSEETWTQLHKNTQKRVRRC